MSDIELSGAVEAAAREHLASVAPRYPADAPIEWDDLTPVQQHAIREHSLIYVTAAAPLIERAVREKVAAEIEAESTDVILDSGADDLYARAIGFGMGRAARIARGGAS